MSKHSGLISAWIPDDAGGGRQAGWETVDAWQPSGSDWLWLHFDYPRSRVQAWRHEKSGLSSLTVEALKQTETRLRVVPADGGLMMFLRAVNLNPVAEPDDMVSACLWMGERRMISMRQCCVVSIDDLRAALFAGKGPATPGDFPAILVDGLLDRIDLVVEVIHEHIDNLEAPCQPATIPVQCGQLAEQTNQRMFLLPVIAAIVLPLSFVTGLPGINVGGTPGADNALGFSMMVILLPTGVALWMYFHSREWF